MQLLSTTRTLVTLGALTSRMMTSARCVFCLVSKPALFGPVLKKYFCLTTGPRGSSCVRRCNEGTKVAWLWRLCMYGKDLTCNPE